jgi:hypothetical protein
MKWWGSQPPRTWLENDTKLRAANGELKAVSRPLCARKSWHSDSATHIEAVMSAARSAPAERFDLLPLNLNLDERYRPMVMWWEQI